MNIKTLTILYFSCDTTSGFQLPEPVEKHVSISRMLWNWKKSGGRRNRRGRCKEGITWLIHSSYIEYEVGPLNCIAFFIILFNDRMTVYKCVQNIFLQWGWETCKLFFFTFRSWRKLCREKTCYTMTSL